MPSKSTETYRRILDAGDITANAVCALLVEKLGNNVDKKELTDLVASTTALIKSKNSQLIDSLQKSRAL